MPCEPRDTRFDTSDAACLKRGWRMANVWLAALLALVGLAGCAVPRKLAIGRSLHLAALREVRRLEALLRRLTFAIAVETGAPARAVVSTSPAPTRGSPPPMTRIALSPAGLGLAQMWRPGAPETPAPQMAPVSRAPDAPTISLVEPWPDMRDGVSDAPWPEGTRFRAGPRIRSFDETPAPAGDAPDLPDLSPERLARRIAALKAVTADPSRMVRRMSRWMARRRAPDDPDYRPTPLCVGLPRFVMDIDQREILLDATRLAKRRRWFPPDVATGLARGAFPPARLADTDSVHWPPLAPNPVMGCVRASGPDPEHPPDLAPFPSGKPGQGAASSLVSIPELGPVSGTVPNRAPEPATAPPRPPDAAKFRDILIN